jgi:iron-sulfur cluster repair protein YtfE (RIC family)
MMQTALTELCATLPRIEALAQKVSRVHGPGDPRLVELSRVVDSTARSLRELAHGGAAEAPAESAAGLERMRTLTDGFLPPSHACSSYRTLLSSLEDLEQTALPLLG